MVLLRVGLPRGPEHVLQGRILELAALLLDVLQDVVPAPHVRSIGERHW